MTPEEIRRRAEHARQLLEDKLLKEALDLMEAEAISQWESVPVRDVEGREVIWRYYKTIRKFRGFLQSALESGKLENFREQQKRSFMDRTSDAVSAFRR